MSRSTVTATICGWALALAACGGTSSDEGALEVGGSGESGTGTTTETSTSEDSSTDTGETTAAQTETDETETDTGLPDEPPTVLFPRSRIEDAELAVLVNDNDPQSVAVADYYMTTRGLPAENLIHLSFPVAANLTQADFELAYADMQAELPDGIQALALSWTLPYLVDCMSVTTAFSAGFDLGFCGGCAVTTTSPYYNSASFAPFDDHGIRPTMMLAGSSPENVFALIDRGLLADGSTHPVGDGYLIRTTDPARSVRYVDFLAIPSAWDHDGGLTMTYIDNASGMGSDVITDTQDVMFYFTGLASVPGIETNTYLPGAIADHLTSFGGQVPTSGQMSAVAWLEAGATASFGTVVEPCNHLQKFPRASVAIEHYFRGETLIEAYSKSVEWPGQGLFVGDPLARPWDGSSVEYDSATGLLSITTNLMQPGFDYRIEEAPTADGPWTLLFMGSVGYTLSFTFEIPNATSPFYRMVPVP